MSSLLQSLWHANIGISLLLAGIMLARFLIRKTTKVYNAYLLWLSIPAGLLAAWMVSLISFSQPPVESVTRIVQGYFVQPADAFDTWSYTGYLWAMVTVMLLFRLALQHFQLRRNLDDIRINTSLDFRSRYPIISINKRDFSPAVYGFFRPAIYFPVQLLSQLSADQIALIIKHEEHHIRQQHLWLNLLWDILVCCMWFNPLVYISRRNFRHDQELYCDYLVLNKSTPQDHKSYGRALLSTVSATHSVSLLCSWKTFNQLEERIMNIKKSSSLSSKLSLAISSLAIIIATSVYTVSASEHSEQKTADPKREKTVDKIIEIRLNDKTYVEKNGERYMDEGDTHRQMTDEERMVFEKEMENAHKHMMQAEKEMGDVDMEMDGDQQHKRIYKKVIIDHDDVDQKHHEVEMERHQLELDEHQIELQTEGRD